MKLYRGCMMALFGVIIGTFLGVVQPDVRPARFVIAARPAYLYLCAGGSHRRRAGLPAGR